MIILYVFFLVLNVGGGVLFPANIFFFFSPRSDHNPIILSLKNDCESSKSEKLKIARKNSVSHNDS